MCVKEGLKEDEIFFNNIRINFNFMCECARDHAKA